MTDHDHKSEPDQQVVVVTFQLGSQAYALPIAAVRQIIEMITITPLPQVSDTILGVINFHGLMVPVVSMRRLLGLSEIPLKLHTPIILATISDKLVGLIVDQVLDVIGRPVDQVIDPNTILPEEIGEAPLLQGLIHAEGGSILLLSPEHLFKPYLSRALSEVIQVKPQSMEDIVSGNGGHSPSPVAPLLDNHVDKTGKVKPETKKGNASVNRKRNKEGAVKKNKGGTS